MCGSFGNFCTYLRNRNILKLCKLIIYIDRRNKPSRLNNFKYIFNHKSSVSYFHEPDNLQNFRKPDRETISQKFDGKAIFLNFLFGRIQYNTIGGGLSSCLLDFKLVQHKTNGL